MSRYFPPYKPSLTHPPSTIGKGCQNHDELKNLKKRGADGWEWSGMDDYGLQWDLDWNDKGDGCDMKCADVFDIFKEDNKCKRLLCQPAIDDRTNLQQVSGTVAAR